MTGDAAELQRLFGLYTRSSDGIGVHLTKSAARTSRASPILVSTGTDVAFFPGGGAPPSLGSFRLTTRGFVEMAALSHLGPALGALVMMARDNSSDTPWETDALRLRAQVERVRAINRLSVWRDEVGVEAWNSRLPDIVDMIDYACTTTVRYLDLFLTEPGHRNFESLRRDYLEAQPVPFNAVMVATFSLVALDLAHRMFTWFDTLAVDWPRLMVLITGQAGRPTAGLTLETNNMAHLLRKASGGRLSAEAIYVAPTAEVFELASPAGSVNWTEREDYYRDLWCNVRVNSRLAAAMFEGHPAFRLAVHPDPIIGPATSAISRMPGIAAPEDLSAWVSRLRFALEDSRELLSNSVSNVIVDMLHESGNRPERVFIPGLTNTRYPASDRRSE